MVTFPLKQKLEEKVPLRHQREPSYLALLELIRRHNLEDEGQLHHFLGQNISMLEAQVIKNRSAPFRAKTLHDQISQLEALKNCQRLVRCFLI
jgi:hypothetical protein